MATNAGDVMIGTTGAVYFAVAGTALPASAVASVAAFSDFGYISDKGVTFTPAVTTNQIKAWQNGDVVSDSETQHTYEVDFECLETNENVLNAWYSTVYDTVADTGQIKGGQVMRGVWVFDVVSGVDLTRHVLPDAKVIARTPLVWANGQPILRGFKLNAYPDASSVKSYEYFSSVGAS
jgi:hypothetical protein